MTELEKYLQTLTPEEREKHKDLIKECLEREKSLDNMHDAIKDIKQIFGSISGIYKIIDSLNNLYFKRDKIDKDKLN